jgi:hypothetical protein
MKTRIYLHSDSDYAGPLEYMGGHHGVTSWDCDSLLQEYTFADHSSSHTDTVTWDDPALPTGSGDWIMQVRIKDDDAASEPGMPLSRDVRMAESTPTTPNFYDILGKPSTSWGS